MAMVKDNLSIWQLGGGPASRPYADVFLKHGVGLIGPGDAGAWKPERDDDEFEGGFVRRFVSEMQVGDVVLLRTGIATITAVGIVASDYMYLNQFDDVNGWDLQHARRIRWIRLPQEYTFGTQVFGANPTRCSRTWNEEVKDYAERFLNSPPTHWQETPLPELPGELYQSRDALVPPRFLIDKDRINGGREAVEISDPWPGKYRNAAAGKRFLHRCDGGKRHHNIAEPVGAPDEDIPGTLYGEYFSSAYVHGCPYCMPLCLCAALPRGCPSFACVFFVFQR